MKRNNSHITKEELKRLLLSEDNTGNLLDDKELHKIEQAVDAYDDFKTAQSADVDEAWQKMNANRAKATVAKPRRLSRTVWLYAAGAVAAIGLILLSLYPISEKQQNNKVIENQIVYVTATGGKVNLPDGSVVSLNENSTLKYPKQFIGNERNVELSGEAFFEVKRDTLHPFMIKAADAHVKVLGTSFNVNALKADRVEVIVATGKVEVWHSNFDKHVFITPGRKSIAFTEVAPVVLDADMNEIAWKTGVLKFNNCTLGYIAASLSKTYHKPITIDAQIEKLRLTATFDNQTLDDVLSVVAKTHRLNVKLEGEGFQLAK